LAYFDYGAKARAGEIASLRYFYSKYPHFSGEVYPLPAVFPPNPITSDDMTADHRDDYLPGRNLLFAACALPLAVQLGAPHIYIGAAPLPFNDPMREWALDMQGPFIDAFNDVVSKGYGKNYPHLVAPLLHYAQKEDYVKIALRTEPNLFEHTTSCYQSETLTPCGRCAHCAYREELRKKVFEKGE
jgi:7-cyano-7-deazaguanine synthase in queuosine biosynthesis